VITASKDLAAVNIFHAITTAYYSVKGHIGDPLAQIQISAEYAGTDARRRLFEMRRIGLKHPVGFFFRSHYTQPLSRSQGRTSNHSAKT
jgi:hypothetical protein